MIQKDWIWGESAYKNIAGEEKEKPEDDTGTPATPATPAKDSSSSPWWFLGGAAGLALTLFSAGMQCRARQAEYEASRPKDITGQQLLEIVRRAENIDMKVVQPESTPAPGEPDAVEAEFVALVETLRKDPFKNWKELDSAMKSLEYWRERKRRGAAGLPSHPPATIKIPQSR